MRLKKIYLTLFIIFSSGVLYAQNSFESGFLIIAESDTVHGFIRFPGWEFLDMGIEFKKNELSEIQKFKPDSIRGFSIAGDKFISKKTEIDLTPLSVNISRTPYEIPVQYEEKTIFLNLLIEGSVSLYYHRDTERENYFIETSSLFNELISHESLFELNGYYSKGTVEKYRYRQQLAALPECSTLDPSNLSFSRKAFYDFITQCNNANGNKLVYTRPTEEKTYFSSIYSSLNFARIQYSGINDVTSLKAKPTFSFGFTREVYDRFRNPYRSFYYSFGFSSYGSKADKAQEHNVTLRYLELSQGFKFRLTSKKNYSFFKIGIHESILFSETTNFNGSISKNEPYFLTNSFILGINLGFGVKVDDLLEIGAGTSIFRHYKGLYYDSQEGPTYANHFIKAFKITASLQIN